MSSLGLMMLVAVIVLLVRHVDGRRGDAEAVVDEVAWGRSDSTSAPRNRKDSGLEPRPDAFRVYAVLAGDADDEDDYEAFENFGFDADDDAFGFDDDAPGSQFRALCQHEDDDTSAELWRHEPDAFDSTCSASDPFEDHAPSWHDDLHDDLHDDGHCINPATGLPMVGDRIGGIDVGGNPYGFRHSDPFEHQTPIGNPFGRSHSHWT